MEMLYTVDDVKRMLARQVKEAGSIQLFCDRAGIERYAGLDDSEKFIGLSVEVLKAINLEEVRAFRRLGD